jgi:PAS domain S-box-containing protein
MLTNHRLILVVHMTTARDKYSKDEKLQILQEASIEGISAVCEKYNISLEDFSAWQMELLTVSLQAESELKTQNRSLEEKISILQQQSDQNLQFRRIIECAPEPIFIQSDLKFVYLNKAACHLMGVNHPEELIGTPVMDRFPPDYHPIILGRVARLKEENPVYQPLEHKLIRMDGTEVWIETTGERCTFNGKTSGLVFIRDISARKEHEKIISIEDQRIHYALETSGVGVWEIDLSSNKITRSQTHDYIYGYQEMLPEWTKELFMSHVHPDDRELISNLFKSSILDKKNWEVEFRIIRNDGQLRWIWSSGKCITNEHGQTMSLIGIIQDITHRKEVESNLKHNYAMLRFAGEIAKFGSWSVDLRDKLVIWSESLALIHETPPDYYPTIDEAINFYAPEWREKIREKFFDCVHKGIPFSEEMQIISTRGRRIWIRTMGEAVRESGKITKIQGALQDINEIKQAQLEIKESETKFRNVFQNHAAVKLIIDPDNGQIVEANEAAARFYGWSVEEMKKMKISQINALSEAKIKREMENARHNITTFFNFKHNMADGSIKDVEVFSSNIIINGKEYLHSIVHDVSEKRQAETQLKLLSRSVEQSPVSVVITDISGNIEYVNPSFTTITGYPMDEVKGKNLRILKSGYQTPEFYKHLWDTIRSGKEWTGEFINKKKNGQLYWEDTVISPILNDHGEITNFVSITEDISHRKKMMEDLIEAKKRAEESDKLKSAFLTNMSHEIRTPMNGILGFTEILKDPKLTGQQHKEFIDIIQKSGQRMLDTVNDLVDISKIETGQVKMYCSETNINELIENLYKFFLPQAQEKNLQLKLKKALPAKYATIYTDKNKLNSILTNLIKNAVKFTDFGVIEMGCIPRNNYLEFIVSDSGIGIPPDRQSAIFNRFEQADLNDVRVFQGSGLGLAISKAYVEMLGGKIWVDSKPGQGSTFYFTLPDKNVQEKIEWEPDKEVIEKSPVPRLNGKKILIAEDDRYGQELMIYLLRKTGADLVLAKDGQEAVELHKKDEFDLVLLDIRLPQMDGFEVLKHLRAQKPDLIIIAQSAFAMTEETNKIQQSGFTDYISKPINLDQLYKLLNNYLGNNNQ